MQGVILKIMGIGVETTGLLLPGGHYDCSFVPAGAETSFGIFEKKLKVKGMQAMLVMTSATALKNTMHTSIDILSNLVGTIHLNKRRREWNGKNTLLPMADDLRGESEYVFHHPNGNPILKDSYMHYLKRKCEKLGIPITNNHAFRVAFNARLIAAGIDGNDRCLVLGHSMQTNERNYSFSDKRKANDIRDKLNNLAL